jgi:hypothetical protein
MKCKVIHELRNFKSSGLATHGNEVGYLVEKSGI